MQLNDVGAYIIAFHLSNYIWDIVLEWDFFTKDTIGKQFTRAVDSISANIAEGFGRYSKADRIKFYRYSFGSLKESLDWNEKAKCRKLISNKEYNHIFTELQKLPREINSLIQYTKTKLRV